MVTESGKRKLSVGLRDRLQEEEAEAGLRGLQAHHAEQPSEQGESADFVASESLLVLSSLPLCIANQRISSRPTAN